MTDTNFQVAVEIATRSPPSTDDHPIIKVYLPGKQTIHSSPNVPKPNCKVHIKRRSKSASSVSFEKQSKVKKDMMLQTRGWKSTSDLNWNKNNNLSNVDNSCLPLNLSKNVEHVEDMMLEHVCLKFGLHSQEVNNKCQSIVEYLKTIKGVKRVWPSYKASNKDSIVFIVFIEVEMDRRALLLPYPYNNLNIRLKSVKSQSDENNNVTSSEIYDKADLSDEDMIKLNNVFSREAPDLLEKHSNLCSILISPVKSKQNGKNIIEVACFVLYVHAKGLIPRNEEEFPRVIDGIPTDVREGTFSVYGALLKVEGDHRAQEFHNELCMGCMLSRYGAGTIGPFLTDQSGKIFCLTSAHVLLSNQEYIQLQNDGKMVFNDISRNPTAPLDVYQPDINTTDIAGNIKPFGKMKMAVYKGNNPLDVGVEIVLVEVTEQQRSPTTGEFPEGLFINQGFHKDNPLTFKTGLQIDKTSKVKRTEVVKYGSETGITTGTYKKNGMNVYRDTLTEGSIILYNQIQINSTWSTVFAKPGDSGALVLVPFNGNDEDMRALGLVVGGMDGHTISVTPLWDIFEALNEPSLNLKRF